MGIYTQLPDHLEEVDVIIAGGGTAACIIAARLSDADAELSILLIERGQDNHEDPSVIYPLAFLSALSPDSNKTLFYKAVRESQLADRELIVPSGGMLGGGSSINLMMYSRAQRHDWDSWKMPGWSANDMIPFLKKLETYHGPGPMNVHGDGGPVHISNGTYAASRSQQQFIKAAQQVGYPEHQDLQNLDSNNGVQQALRFIGTNGRRQDTAHCYLHPRLQDGAHPHLHVLVQSEVMRVLFDGQRATSIEYRSNPTFQSSTMPRTVRARRLIVASCGALGTPLLLERSGLGNKSILEKAGVSTIAHLPGVGENYQDHHLMTYPYYSALKPNETVDGLFAGRQDMAELIRTKDPMLGWNAQDITCKIRPTEADLAALGPDFQAAYDKDFRSEPNKPLALVASLNAFPGDPSGVPAGQYFSTSTFSVYPYSRGHIHITSPETGVESSDFETGFLRDALDVKKLIWVYKKQREIVRRMDIYRGEFEAGHPQFPSGPAAASAKFDTPPPNMTVDDLVYTAEDDAAIEDWVRSHVGTTWHSLGTCRMGTLEDGGVLSPRLDVHGVSGLKIADLSIAPENVAANTADTAMVIGEKAASIIMQDLELGPT